MIKFVSKLKLEYIPTKEQSKQIKCSEDVAQYGFSFIDEVNVCETMIALFTDRQNFVCGFRVLGTGSMNQCAGDMKMLFSSALLCRASGVVLIHNHPSGNLVPSEADKAITQKIKQGCALLDLTMLDHIIISPEGKHFSFVDSGIF